MSARDDEKAAQQREALGGAPPALRGQVFSMVLCGTSKVQDGWMFSDALGFAQVFREQPGNIDFYSCFDVAGHFKWLKSEGLPDKDIKFGQYGPKGEHIYVYERSRFEQCHPFWQQHDPDDLLARYDEWIEEAKRIARPGDVVNIVLLCHGSRKGMISIGKKPVFALDLIEKLKDFQENVHLNLIANTCFGGHLADAMDKSQQSPRYVAVCHRRCRSFAMPRSVSGRYRVGRLINAYVESLLKAISEDSSPPADGKYWNVEQHNIHLRRCLEHENVPEESRSPPVFVNTGFEPPEMALKHLMLRDNTADDEEREILPREINWEVANRNIHEIFARTLSTVDHQQQQEEHVTLSAMALAQAEGDMCNIDLGDPSEMQIYNEFFSSNTNWKVVLTNMYWRSFRQAAIWNVFLRLLQKGLVNTKCLSLPVNLQCGSEQSSHIGCIISCFEVIETFSHDAFEGRIPGQNVEWTVDIDWLATMIVRSGAELDAVLHEIKATRILGDLCQDAYNKYTSLYPNIHVSHDPKDGEGEMSSDGRVAKDDNIFAFWLPHGLTDDPKIASERLRRSSDRAWAIEKAFREVENPPVGILILDLRPVRFGSDGSNDEKPCDLQHDISLHGHSAPD